MKLDPEELVLRIAQGLERVELRVPFQVQSELAEDQLIGSNDAQRKTFVLLRGKLVPLPEGLQFIVPTSLESVTRSELFSEETRRIIADEAEFQPRKSNGDESVAAFVARHFGNEVVERLADPMLAGVYGGRAANLSMRTIMPRFVQMEEEHGSLIRALQSSAGKRQSSHSIFTTLKNGMQQLLDAMTARLDAAAVHTQYAVTDLRRAEQWKLTGKLRGADFSDDFDAIILATPAHAPGWPTTTGGRGPRTARSWRRSWRRLLIPPR